MANITKVILLDGQEYILRDSTLDGKIAQEVIDRNAAIAEAIRGVTQFDYQVVQTLPESGVKGTIYLVPKTAATQDIYDEYIWVNSAWEHIGSTQIDLSNYYNKTEVDDLLDEKQDTLESGTNIKTVNNQSLLGSGNITIESDGMQLVPGAVTNNIATYGTGGQVKDSSVSISGLLVADDAGSAADTNPINADTLNGHDYTYFLTADNVIDALNSTSTDQALSANQGRILNNNINDLSSDVDDMGDSIDTLSTTVNNKAPLASPSFTGTPTVAANTSYTTAMMRNVILSTSAPTSSMGSNGDICIVYTA